MRFAPVLVALALTGAAGAAVRAPEVPKVPRGGFDPLNLEHVQDLAARMAAHTVRLEGVHRLPPPFDPEHPVVRDGAGVCVAPGRLVTTAAWLDGVERLRVVARDGRPQSVRVLRVDSEADLALLAFDPDSLALVPVAGFVAPVLPEDAPRAAEAVLVMPTVLTGSARGLRQAVAGRTDGVLMLSGAASNGVPAFDRQARVAALARRVAPDLTRSTAVSGEAVARWLEGGEGHGP